MNVPAMPYEAMIDIAKPGEYFRDVDASVNVMGTIAAVPKPTKQNPIIEVQNVGKIIAIQIPENINVALIANVLGIPILSTMRSETKRDIAMQIMKIR